MRFLARLPQQAARLRGAGGQGIDLIATLDGKTQVRIIARLRLLLRTTADQHHDEVLALLRVGQPDHRPVLDTVAKRFDHTAEVGVPVGAGLGIGNVQRNMSQLHG